MRIAAIGLAGVLLVGCTGSDETEFVAGRYRGGDCALAARAVHDIDVAVSDVVTGDAEPDQAAQSLRERQDELREILPSMRDATLRDQAQQVVDAVGFYRIGIDAKNYTPKLAKDVETAAGRFLSACSLT